MQVNLFSGVVVLPKYKGPVPNVGDVLVATAPCTVYFDGACPVCKREIAHYRQQAGATSIAWVDAAVCDSAHLGGLDRDTALARLHVRRADGSLESGAAAFIALWAQLPRYSWLARIAARGPLPAVLEASYAGFLRLRRLWRPGGVDPIAHERATANQTTSRSSP